MGKPTNKEKISASYKGGFQLQPRSCLPDSHVWVYLCLYIMFMLPSLSPPFWQCERSPSKTNLNSTFSINPSHLLTHPASVSPPCIYSCTAVDLGHMICFLQWERVNWMRGEAQESLYIGVCPLCVLLITLRPTPYE